MVVIIDETLIAGIVVKFCMFVIRMERKIDIS